MTTYRSEADFDERFGRSIEPDGRPSIVSYLDHQGDKIIERFDPLTYATLARAMDQHDIAVAWGGRERALQRLATNGAKLTERRPLVRHSPRSTFHGRPDLVEV